LSGHTDTIYARASAPGRAGVAVFRVSGPAVLNIVDVLVSRTLKPRHAQFISVRANDGHVIDQGLAILFPAPASFTGEHVLELHLHGSRAVEIDLYEILTQLGSRQAEAGEFTLRAMKNGKMNLPQVEALADLIDSETTLQRRQALGQLDGAIGARVDEWRTLLLQILTPLAADIDFPDEEGVPAAISANALPVIDALDTELSNAMMGFGLARRVREGASIVLMGAPNAGKSSLLNCLAGNDVAIVSERPGTTRDVVEVRLDLEGMLATFADTAGLRDETDDEIEAEGMRRTRMKADQADVRILVLDVSRETIAPRETFSALRKGDIIVWNKSDLVASDDAGRADVDITDDFSHCKISAKTGEGVQGLLALLSEKLSEGSHTDEISFLTRQRHVDAVIEARDALARARENVMAYPELASEDIRLANRSFNRLVGAIDVEDILGEIFSSFCIGK